MKHFSVQQRRRKRRAGRVRRVLGALLLALCLAAPETPQAADSQIVHSSSGKAMFELVFFNDGEDLNTDPEEEPFLGERDLSVLDRQGTIQAARLWADVLGPQSLNKIPVILYIWGDSQYNAAASSDPLLLDGDWSSNMVLAQLTGEWESTFDAGLVQVGIGFASTGLWTLADHLSPLPSTADPNLTTVIFHEFGHVLGINSSALSVSDENASGSAVFSFLDDTGTANVWDSHLYDMFGTQARPNMTIVRYQAGTSYGSDVFVAGDWARSGITFRGEHVSEVLQGALGGGLPINGFEGTESSVWIPEFSHIELAHSMMSHQNWRNYTFFMEAELAVLQDLGYSIDRRNWYGYSVYNDGLTLTNTNGYWARNAAGTAYLEGQANTATLGTGLHIYGSNNTVTQAADLLACGTAGTGIRVDGTGNTLAVAEGVTVTADGDWGTGLLVAYGKDQIVVNQGSVTATGTGGVAVRFDFGSNMLGDNVMEYRGSWMWKTYASCQDGVVVNTSLTVNNGLDAHGFPLNLDGAMVSRFALSGSIEGSAAAIYIADNAWVKQIDILSGASIRGDILSGWDPENELVQYATLNAGHSDTELTTLLTFGRETLASGLGGDNGDAAFSLVYGGAISGAKSIELEVAGGSLEYNGTASVLSVTVDEGASLSGTGLYSLNTITDEEQGVSVGGTFTNNGTYSPGSGLAAGDGADAIASVSIDGNYEQGETGTLVLSFDEEAATDVLTISGKATLAGTVAFAAVRDYYADGTITLALADMVSAEELAVSESLALDLLDVSPTLDMTLASGTAADGADSSYTISAARSASAYSRYAASGQQAELAGNLDEIGQTDLTAAAGDLGDARELLTALDFSASDGSDLPGAYEELGPDAFTKAAQASLSLQRSLSAQIVNGRLLASASGSNAGQAQAMAAGDEEGSAGSMRVFATPMGGRNVSFSGGGADTSYYGLLAGAETDIALGRDSLTLGVHAAFLHTEGSANDNDKAKGDNISLGLHGRWDPDLSLDAGSLGSVSPYVMGLVRGGLETRHMEREVSFNGYNRKAESDWSAPTFSALLGTGLDVRPCDAIVFGPVLWLDWTAMWRPSVEEDGGLAADLELDAATYQSLRSSLGARVNVRLHDGPDAARLAGSLNLSLTAVWNHEFLYDNGATTARFAHFGSTSFTDRADVSDRDTFGGMLQLTGHLTDNVSLSLFGGLEQGPKTSDAHGGASLVWSF